MTKRSILSRLFRPETKGLADPSSIPPAWFGGWGQVAGGVAISPQEALQVTAVAAAMRVISEAAACLDIRIQDVGGKIVEGHAAGEFLRGAANDWTSGYELVRDLMIDALSDDRGGLAWINRIGGEVREVIRYRTGAFDVQLDQDTGELFYKIRNRPIDAADVVHLRAPFGKAPLTLAREAIGVAWVLQRHAGEFFKNMARPSGYLKFPSGMGKEAVTGSRDAWKEAHGGAENSGKTPILYDGAEWLQMAMNSTDAQFLENRKFQIAEIARAFRVPPSMLFDLDRATWGNTEQMGREFLTYCLEPWLRALEGALTRALFSGADKGRLRVVFDRDDMTRADLQTRATTLSSLIAAKVLTPAEGRPWVNMPARKDAPDIFENPHISTAGDAAGNDTMTGAGDETGE